MRITASHSTLLLAVTLSLGLAGCPADEEGGIDIDLNAAIRVNDASEEVLGVIVDQIEQGNLTVDDTRAATIVMPSPATAVPADTAYTFAWSVAAKPTSPRHGTIDGSFVWLRLEGGGLERTIDVVAVDANTWTPDAAVWAELTAATGPISITLTNAFATNGLIAAGDGPFRSTEPTTTFSIAQ